MKLLKLFSIVTLLLLQAAPIYAETKLQKKLNFNVDTKSLYQGDLHYSVSIISPERLSEKYTDLAELDSLSLAQQDNVKLVLMKSAYIVNKPVGFFDHQTMIDEKFLTHFMGEQKVQKKGENHYQITVPGEGAHKYDMRSFFDSDDISTLPNSRVIRAVTQAKKLDVISGSASSIIFKELTNYSRYSKGGVQVSSFVPLKENKTLVLSYSINAVKKPFAIRRVLQENYAREIEAQKRLIESFK
jgi:hypothetical protein